MRKNVVIKYEVICKGFWYIIMDLGHFFYLFRVGVCTAKVAVSKQLLNKFLVGRVA